MTKSTEGGTRWAVRSRLRPAGYDAAPVVARRGLGVGGRAPPVSFQQVVLARAKRMVMGSHFYVSKHVGNLRKNPRGEAGKWLEKLGKVKGKA
ncbi:MAG: hypothetical protein Q7S40_21505 [Opitutaceae bacterium]|nr:hypothetical protein [Opitutaceae bacterium]